MIIKVKRVVKLINVMKHTCFEAFCTNSIYNKWQDYIKCNSGNLSIIWVKHDIAHM